jgi:hypothetical protein
LTVEVPLANAQAISEFLATLQPKTDAQKAALATANQYSSMVEQSRLLISLQVASGPVSGVLIAILVFWTAALFFGIGLYAEPNALVYAALAFGALSIAFAIFLIFEFGMPFTGLYGFRPPPSSKRSNSWTSSRTAKPTAAFRYVRFTSIRDIESVAKTFRFGSIPAVRPAIRRVPSVRFAPLDFCLSDRGAADRVSYRGVLRLALSRLGSVQLGAA